MSISREPYVDITQGIRGWFAVLLRLNDDGFYEPWNSGYESYASPAEAAQEARIWAYLEDIRCAFYGPVYLYEISTIDSVQETQEGEEGDDGSRETGHGEVEVDGSETRSGGRPT